MARTWRSWKPGTPLARMPNGAAAAETDRRSLQKCKAELRREPAVPFGVCVPENQTRDFRETPASRVRCSTVSGSPDADETTRTLLRDGRAGEENGVGARSGTPRVCDVGGVGEASRRSLGTPVCTSRHRGPRTERAGPNPALPGHTAQGGGRAQTGRDTRGFR